MKEVRDWLATWAPHCGAPRDVFEGQFKVVLCEIFDEIERAAEIKMMTGKLEGSHYAAMNEMRDKLGVERRTKP